VSFWHAGCTSSAVVPVPPESRPSQSPEQEPDYIDQRFRLLIESLTDFAVFMIDLSGATSSWNPGIERVLGYNEAEFIGLDFSALFTPEDVAQGRPAEELERALATGRFDDKRDHLRKDGSRFRADGVVTVIRDEAGAPQGFSKVMHDVTAQHQASEALRQSAQQYRLLVDSVRDYAIFMLDASGQVASWSPAAERMKGYRADEIIGRHFRIFFMPEDQQRGKPEQELATAQAAGRAEGEGWRVRKDGSRFWGDEIVAPIRGESGALRGYAKVVRDLTHRQRASLEREQLYAQAQEANRLKDEFLGTVSHELRTPLNAILGWIHLLAADEINLDERRRRHALMTIKRNAEIQTQLVDDLLDVSRIIAGKMRLEIRPVKLSEVLQAAADAVQPAAQAKGVALHLSIDPATELISADPDRLQQIVWNLLSNAIKFTPSGGRVQLATRQSRTGIDIIVEDDGAGIPTGLLPFIFDRFRQADSSTTRSHGGVGLGLAIVRHLTELHGGSVDAVSHGAGRGARFSIHLPTGAAASLRAARVPVTNIPSSIPDQMPLLTNVRVVLVDDDPDTREVLHAVLGTSGADVIAAESTAQGLAAIEQRVPDVIIADIGMPGEDGYAFIEQARTLLAARGVQPPAIALTAYARLEDRERVLAAGFQRQIAKPADPRTVVMAVTELVRPSA
jgi:PAS domain S-box-containing protein